MKLFHRPGLLLLWTVAAVLLLAGAYATHAERVTVQTPAGTQAPVVQRPDTLLTRQRPGAVDSAAAQPSGPPATGVGGATAPIDAAAAAAASPQQTGQQARARDLDTPLRLRLMSLVGMVVLLLIAWGLSVNRALIPWRVILWGIGLQLVFALLILKTTAGVAFFDWINDVIVSLLGFTEAGARFLFGNLVVNNVPVAAGEPGMGPAQPIAGTVANTGAFFAFSILPTIVFFSSLTTLLYYFGVMQAVVKSIAWVMMRTMRTSGAETLSAAGNIFLGQTEAPLLIKPYVAGMTMSELMAVMVGGFANIAGGVMAAFVGLLIFYIPDIAGHLLAASVMSAPGTLVFAKLMYPELGEPATRGQLRVDVAKVDANVIDAAARGAGEGLHLAFNVGAMLLAFIALIAVINALLGWIGELTQLTTLLEGFGWLAEGQRLNLQSILGWLCAPLAWVMGVPWSEATTVGGLIGVKTSVNEFVAYLQLSELLAGGADLSARSVVIASYALCGFANFSSIAIQIGGIGGMAPARRSDLARLGLRAMIGGSLATFMTATIAGMLISMARLETALSAVRAQDPRTPDVALILGSGLGALADELAEPVRIPFTQIPGFPPAAVVGHAGRLVIGMLERHTCVVLQGRLHLYEGYDPAVVALPTRVMLGLGARTLIVTNAAGGIASTFRAGDLMLIEDHINFTGRNPLVGPALPDEPRFPDMTAAYDPGLREVAEQAAAAEGVQLVRGVYAAALGPSYETPAEVKLLGMLGADAVGMSTVPEVIVARARGVPVLGISLISNAAAGITGEPLSHDEVIAAGAAASGRVARLLRGVLRRLPVP